MREDSKNLAMGVVGYQNSQVIVQGQPLHYIRQVSVTAVEK